MPCALTTILAGHRHWLPTRIWPPVHSWAAGGPAGERVARVASELNLTPADLRIELMGNVASLDGVPIEAMAREEGVTAMLGIHAPGSRAQALEFLARANMVVVLPQDSDMAIPAKIFDYARFHAWILAFAAGPGGP